MDVHGRARRTSADGQDASRHRAAVHLFAVLCACVAAALVLVETRLGVGATPDTGHYLATADSVREGRGFVRMGPEIMASWPPLYPTMLAAFGSLGVDMLVAARLLNVVALAIAAAAGLYWITGRTQSLWWGAITGAAIAIAPPLVYSASLALTDAPFLPLLVTALWRLDVWLTQPRRSTFAACILLIALACLMRYNGVVLIATAVCNTLLFANLNAASRIRHALIMGLAASAPLAAWFVRNLWLTGTVAGPRVPSEYSVAEACADAGYTIMSWFVPYRVLTTSRWTGLILLLVGLAVVGALALRVRRRAGGQTAIVCLGFVTAFLAFMIYTFTRVSVDPLADRMLAPVYVPLVVALVASVAATVAGLPSSMRRPAAVGVALAASLAGLIVSARTAQIVRDSWQNGPGGAAHSNFNTPEWRSSPTLRWTGEHLREELVFASSPAALYIATGTQARPMPRKHARRSPGVPHDRLPVLRDEVAKRGDAYLVVSNDHVPSHTFSIEELGAAFVVERVQTFPDGTVYRLTPAPEP